MNKKMILIIGPFIGDFEQEILTFRPWARWLMDLYENDPEFDSIYIHSHFNRFFMYDFISEDCLIPVYENLTRDEINQQEYIHTTIEPKDYNILIKNIKELIIEKENCSKKDIQMESLSYTKYIQPIPVFKKIFSKIQCDIDIEEYTNKLVFIPSNVCKRKELLKIKNFLKRYDDFIIIGDKKCKFKKDNSIINRIDYSENGYKLIIKIISSAKAVICPLSFWTTICNLQQVPVFSWGEQVGQHKESGIYNFGNKNCLAFPSSDMDVTLKMLKYFLQEIYDEQ